MMTPVEIHEEKEPDLSAYAEIRMAFEVSRVLEVAVVGGGFGGMVLSERVLAAPYVKDYDAVEPPAGWLRSFDLSNWGFFSAWADGVRVGGAAVAFDTPGLDMLERRKDLAVLWDLRVADGMRRWGVGAALSAAVEAWAAARGCGRLKVETQNVNVPACRFYAARGFVLRSIDRSAYPDLPDETQLIWEKALGKR